MSEIYLNYSQLQDSLSWSKKSRDLMSGYVRGIQNNILSKIPDTGTPYTSTAATLAQSKIQSLTDKSARFLAYETSVSELISCAKKYDGLVSTDIETIADLHVKKRPWYRNIADGIYNTFCVDLVNKWDLTRTLADAGKWVGDKIGNAWETVTDWFKYGDGKYLANIAGSVLGAITAVGGAIAAVCAIPFTGGATIPIAIGLLGAAAASVGAYVTVINSATSVTQNAKALTYAGNIFNPNDGDPSAARYLGSQNTYNEYAHKTDFGGWLDNALVEIEGNQLDEAKKQADTVSFLCSIASLGNVRDFRLKNSNANINTRYNSGHWYKGYSFTPHNITRNILHDMGYKVTTGALDGKSAFDFKKSIFAQSYTSEKKFTMRWDGGSWSLNENAATFFRDAQMVKNITDVEKNVSNLGDYFSYRDTSATWKDTLGAIESGGSLLGHSNYFAPFNKYLIKGEKTIRNMPDLFLK